jgi:hypothetical protein
LIKSPTDDVVDIPAKSVFDTHKTLGHYKAPAGTSKTQLHKIQTKQSHLSQCLASSPANNSQAYPSIIPFTFPQFMFWDNPSLMPTNSTKLRKSPCQLSSPNVGTIATYTDHSCTDPPTDAVADPSGVAGFKVKLKS